ncbi:MAG: hypothetical protein L0Y71_05805 [Gemmataceae bacterium]|nr:hypothetical protein [Gemmataceae bacterium]
MEETLKQPPKELIEALPEDVGAWLEGWGWYVVLGVAAVILLLVLLGLFSFLRRLFARKPRIPTQNLEERFAEYPPLKPSSGDRRLTIEGVPVRLRLVVVAAAGTESGFDDQQIDKLLDRVLPGLGGIFNADKPRVRIWPMQLSHEGFARHLHRSTIIPEGERQLSKWAVVAGRARLDDCHVMLGLGLEAIKPTTIGRKTIDSHEWDVLLRVRTRE